MCLVVDREIAAAVAWPVGHVQPLVAVLVDGLVNGQAQLLQ